MGIRGEDAMSKKAKTMDLPPGCPACRNGRLPFIVGPEGARRCDCPRGIALTQMDRAKVEVGSNGR